MIKRWFSFALFDIWCCCNVFLPWFGWCYQGFFMYNQGTEEWRRSRNGKRAALNTPEETMPTFSCWILVVCVLFWTADITASSFNGGLYGKNTKVVDVTSQNYDKLVLANVVCIWLCHRWQTPAASSDWVLLSKMRTLCANGFQVEKGCVCSQWTCSRWRCKLRRWSVVQSLQHPRRANHQVLSQSLGACWQEEKEEEKAIWYVSLDDGIDLTHRLYRSAHVKGYYCVCKAALSIHGRTIEEF